MRISEILNSKELLEVGEWGKKKETTPKYQIDVEHFGNWTVKMSDRPIVMGDLTGPTAKYVAIVTHKQKKYANLYFRGVGQSQAEARDDALAKARATDRPIDPDQFKSFSIDLNVEFSKQYLDPRSGNYFKFKKEGDDLYLVMASPRYFKEFGGDLEELGFKKATSRVDVTGTKATEIYGITLSHNTVKKLRLIPNMRYSLEKLQHTDSDGNTLFLMHQDTRSQSSRDKYRMGIPGLTVGATEKKIDENDVIGERADDNGNTSCWKGYRKVGLKRKGGKMVNDCRPVKK